MEAQVSEHLYVRPRRVDEVHVFQLHLAAGPLQHHASGNDLGDAEHGPVEPDVGIELTTLVVQVRPVLERISRRM
jgi:hypothetical protein